MSLTEHTASVRVWLVWAGRPQLQGMRLSARRPRGGHVAGRSLGHRIVAMAGEEMPVTEEEREQQKNKNLADKAR